VGTGNVDQCAKRFSRCLWKKVTCASEGKTGKSFRASRLKARSRNAQRIYPMGAAGRHPRDGKGKPRGARGVNSFQEYPNSEKLGRSIKVTGVYKIRGTRGRGWKRESLFIGRRCNTMKDSRQGTVGSVLPYAGGRGKGAHEGRQSSLPSVPIRGPSLRS